jgi:general secretion pathway protein A
MVLDHYQLQEDPFGAVADERHFYLGAPQQKALDSLLYALQAKRGFLALIAGEGQGKTTLLLHLLEVLQDEVTPVFLAGPLHTGAGVLRAILDQLGEPDARGSVAELQMRLRRLFEERHRLGKRVLLVVNEAHTLDDSLLELVRVLSNFETAGEKTIQIILAGQPGLVEKISSPDMVQLRQRISLFARLEPFSAEETGSYIQHRVQAAGYAGQKPLFTRTALALIAQHSGGVPEKIDRLCINALSMGFAFQAKAVNGDMVQEVAEDAELDRWPRRMARTLRLQATRKWLSPKAAWAVSVVLSIACLLGLSGALLAHHHQAARRAAMAKARGAAVVAPVASSLAPSARASLPAVQPSLAPAKSHQAKLAATPARKGRGAQRHEPVATADLQGMDLGTAVKQLSGSRLRKICKENFGTCNAKRLAEMRRLNPRLGDPRLVADLRKHH